MKLRILDNDDNIVMVGTMQEVADYFGLSVATVKTVSSRGKIIKKIYRVEKVKKPPLHEREYGVCDTKDNELLVFCGNLSECSKWLGVAEPTIRDALFHKNRKIGYRYEVFELE